MTTEPSNTKQSVAGVFQKKPHPAVTVAATLFMICVVIWWANLNGLFPGMDGWKNEKDRQTMYSLAKRVGGDYNKLTDAERKWVEETAHGHGRMSMGMYSGQAGVSATPPVPAPGRGAPGPGRTPPDNKAHP